MSFVKKYKYAVVIVLLLTMATATFMNLTKITQNPEVAKRRAIALTNWNLQYHSFKTALSNNSKYPAVLYNFQISTNLFFDYAYHMKQYQALDQIAELMLLPYARLHEQPFVWIYKGSAYQPEAIPSPVKIWGSQLDFSFGNIFIPAKLEGILNSSQFLYYVSRAINKFLALPSNRRTQNMNQVINLYSDIIINHHYKRWLVDTKPFQVKAWGCNPGNYSHRDFMYAKQWKYFGGLPHDLSYCNSLSDKDLWITAGILEILSAHAKNPARVPISISLKEEMKLTVSTGMSFLTLRLTDMNATDFNGNTVTAQNLDAGAWEDHLDSAYAGYEGAIFPTVNDKQKVSHIAFDISHARRLVQVLRTLVENKHIHGYSFPLTSDFKKLSNQILYKIFNGNMDYPLFRNYWDGSNGWYRVNYSGRSGFGYAPYDMSLEFLRSGYCTWGIYSPELKNLCNKLWSFISHQGPDTDPIIKHRNDHYKFCLYMNHQRKDCGENFTPNNSSTFFQFISAIDAYAPIPLEKYKDKMELAPRFRDGTSPLPDGPPKHRHTHEPKVLNKRTQHSQHQRLDTI